MDVNGSPECVLTWKHWDMRSGVPICALRGRPRRKSDRDFSGWHSAKATDGTKGGPDGRKGQVDLNFIGSLSIWPTMDACVFQDGESLETWLARRELLKEAKQNGNGCGTPLTMAALLSGRGEELCSPSTSPAEKTSKHSANEGHSFLILTGWATPSSRDWRSDRSQKTTEELYGNKGLPLARQALGAILKSSSVTMEKATFASGALNPAFVLWLQGYPEEWLCLEDSGIPSFLKLQPRLSRRSSKRRKT